MKADTVDLATIFGQPVRYLVPMFQRPYVWERETEWEPLWDDIRAVLERQTDETPANDNMPHFLGAIVLDQVLTPVGMVSKRYIIDGQQRLTTLQIFVAAARRLALDRGFVGPAAALGKLIYNDDFLVKDEEDRYKVAPTAFDRRTFYSVMREKSDPEIDPAFIPHGDRIVQAFRFFAEAIGDWTLVEQDPGESERRFQILSTVLWKLLLVVSIDLDRQDNAQVIFETLNARGTPLLAADLIKNHLFREAKAEDLDIDSLYTTYWKNLDSDWWRAEVVRGRLKRPRLDVFLNAYLAMKLGRDVVSHLLFSEFKRYLAGRGGSTRQILADIWSYSRVYESFEHEPATTRFGKFLYRVSTMEVSTAFPTFLWMWGHGGVDDQDERLQAARVIESWLVRRMIMRSDTKGYTNVFLSLLNRLRESSRPSGSEVADFFRKSEGERSYWPTDPQIRSTLQAQRVYLDLSRGRLRMLLEALEEQLRSSGYAEAPDVPRGLTIEHVLPQHWLGDWPLPIGADQVEATERRESLKHTIGNLTLLTARLNPKLSNSGWQVKRPQLSKHSVLMLSGDLKDALTWDETAIQARSDRLIDLFIEVWPGPDAKW